MKKIFGGVRDDLLSKLCPKLNITIGMHVIVTNNFKGGVRLGIANGTLAKVVGFAWSPTAPRGDDRKISGVWARLDGSKGSEDTLVFRPDELPSHILIKPLIDESYEKVKDCRFTSLEEGVFPLARLSFDVSTKRCGSIIKAKMMQFPLVCADVVTIHKLQGQTMKCALYLPGWKNMTRGGAYVSLSRHRCIENLFLGELPPERVLCARLQPDLLTEMERIERSSAKLVSLFQRT